MPKSFLLIQEQATWPASPLWISIMTGNELSAINMGKEEKMYLRWLDVYLDNLTDFNKIRKKLVRKFRKGDG